MKTLDGEILRDAREYLALSQMEAAEMLDVTLVTYQRWERGETRPHPYNLRTIRLKFKPALQRLGLLEAETEDHGDQPAKPKEHRASPVLPILPSMLPLADESTIETEELIIPLPITLHLLSLADMEPPTNRDKPAMVRQALKERDKMNAMNKNYQITRREAVRTLAALPFATLGLSQPGRVVSPEQYGKALAHCSTSLEACWQLCKARNADDLMLSFKCVSTYLSLLQDIVKNSSQYRQEAAALAGQYAILKTILGWHCKGLADAIKYAITAVTYSKLSENVPLQLSAYSKLAWAYLYGKQFRLALSTAQEAQFVLEHTDIPLPPCIQGGTYSTLALMQARNGVDTDTALSKIDEIDPGDEMHAFMEFTRSDAPREVGMIHYYRGDQGKAMQALEKTVELTANVPLAKRGRVEVFNTMIRSSLKANNRDMEQTVDLWKAATEEATVLRSEWGFHECLMTYELMEIVWPDEKRIADLRDLTEHW